MMIPTAHYRLINEKTNSVLFECDAIDAAAALVMSKSAGVDILAIDEELDAQSDGRFRVFIEETIK